MRTVIPASERFWPKVQKTDTCWLWTAFIDDQGYGRFRVEPVPAAQVKAHRFAYEEVHGPIPDDMVLDHLCRNTTCVNPAHLEVVPAKVNTLRGEGPTAVNARKVDCVNGHELPPRVEGARRRRCHPCQLEADRRYKAKRRVS